MIREPVCGAAHVGDERFKVAGYIKNDDKTYAVSFENGFHAVFSAEEFFKFDLYDEGEENRRTYDELIREVDFGRARAMALKFAKSSPKTVELVRRKLVNDGFGEETVEAVLEALAADGDIDDRVFAERFVRSRAEKADTSGRMLVYELESKGVDRALAAETVEKAYPDDGSAARMIAGKKVKNGDGRDKTARYLLSKGFRTGLVLEVLSEYFGDD